MNTEKQIVIPPVNREIYTAMIQINKVRERLVAYSHTEEGNLIGQTDALDNFCSHIDHGIGQLGDMIGMFAADGVVLAPPPER